MEQNKGYATRPKQKPSVVADWENIRASVDLTRKCIEFGIPERI